MTAATLDFGAFLQTVPSFAEFKPPELAMLERAIRGERQKEILSKPPAGRIE